MQLIKKIINNQLFIHSAFTFSFPSTSPRGLQMSKCKFKTSNVSSRGVKLALSLNKKILCDTINILIHFFVVIENCELEISLFELVVELLI